MLGTVAGVIWFQSTLPRHTALWGIPQTDAPVARLPMAYEADGDQSMWYATERRMTTERLTPPARPMAG